MLDRFCMSLLYVSVHHDFHCNQPRVAQILSESFMWRTDLIFPWRDRLIQAAPAESLSSMIPVLRNMCMCWSHKDSHQVVTLC